MAVLDRERNAIVLRIVYDGPAAAGKTTSVRALGASLGRPVTTPETAGERTLYFDWLDYTAGLFEGYPLRCQVVTVPGQALLARRRRQLVATADAIVFVAPVTAHTLASVTGSLEDLRDVLAAETDDSVGIVLQANKRDLPASLPLGDVVTELASRDLAIRVIESTATSGAGIREAFVFAVRLALDRVREQIRDGRLPTTRPEIDSPEELHRLMRAAELEQPGAPRSTEPEAPTEISTDAILAEDAPRLPTTSGTPRPPDESVPSGMIWPPIEGRVLLGEATMRAVDVQRVESGWAGATDDGWTLHSPFEAEFVELEDGRAALVEWARLHAQHVRILSPRRCIALASDGAGRWRLWQVVRKRSSLRERLASSLDAADADDVAESLVDAAVRLAEMRERFAASSAFLPVTLDTIGVAGPDTLYVGLLPARAVGALPSIDALVDDQMDAIVSDWRRRDADLSRALGLARFRSRSELRGAVIGRLLRLFADRDETSIDADPG